MVNIILYKDEILAAHRYSSIVQITALHSPILSQRFLLTHFTTQKSTIVAIMLNRGICPLCSHHLFCFIHFSFSVDVRMLMQDFVLVKQGLWSQMFDSFKTFSHCWGGGGLSHYFFFKFPLTVVRMLKTFFGKESFYF